VETAVSWWRNPMWSWLSASTCSRRRYWMFTRSQNRRRDYLVLGDGM